MGTIITSKLTNIITNDGMRLVRRVRTVQIPNGKFRYPVDYYDATPGAVHVNDQEREALAIPVYKKIL